MGDRLYQKKPGGTWYGWYYEPNGARIRFCTKCRDRRAAVSALRQRERDAYDPNRAAKDQAKNRIALADVLERFLRHCARRGRAAATIQSYTCKAGHLLRVLGTEVDINSFRLNVEDVYVDQRRDEGASDHTIYKELVVFRATLKRAKRDGLFVLDRDAMRSDHSPNYQPRRTYLTRDHFRLLLAELPPHRAQTVTFVVMTGARDSEWQRMSREHLDFHAGVLTLPGAKTVGSWRRLPLTENGELALLIRNVVEELPRDRSLLFDAWPNIRGDLYAAIDRANKKRESNALPYVSPNDLRRTFGTWCRQAGVATDRIAVLLGHRDARMVERVYGVIDATELGAEFDAAFRGTLSLTSS